jgi:NAD(P)-dependent dehydrogenase (short-subunit alcohol dehydrogenase family)
MKVAVVTGAASGIGLDCANDLVARGWRVFGLDREFRGGEGEGDALECDVADSASVTAAFSKIAGMTKSIDALVCSAGIFRTGPLLEMAEKDFDDLFAVNTRGAWLCAKAALPLLKAAAKPEAPARIVFVASAAALRPKTGGGAYAASKAALVQITKVLAVEMAKQSILVNAIAPATVDTPMTQALAANAAANGYKLSGTSPLGRVATPGDVSSVIRFLLGDDSAYLAGAVIPIDGGTTAAFDPR